MKKNHKNFVKVAFVSLIAVAFLCQFIPVAKMEVVGGEVFLKGNYIEVGIHRSGSFGTSNPAPSGFHPKISGSDRRLGFVVDPQKDGWTNGNPPQSGDFFVPGTPEEGWAVEWTSSGSERTFGNFGLRGLHQIPTTSLTETSSGDKLSAVWEGTAAYAADDKLKITTTIHFDRNAQYFVMSNTMTNIGTTTLNSVEFMRNVDPDQEQPLGAGFATRNYVVTDPAKPNKKLVVGKGLTYGIPLGLGTIDSRAVVSTEGFANRDPDAILDSPIQPSPSSPRQADEAIVLAYRFGNLAPGQSVNFDYAYILNEADLERALGNLAAVSILQPTGTVSGSDVLFQATTDRVSSTTQMAFYVNGVLIGIDSTPDAGGVFETTFDSRLYANGTINLKAVATFTDGTTVEKISTASVDNAGPPISFITPTAGQVFVPGSTIPVSINIDNPSQPPVRVSFFRETASSGSILLGVDTAAPFESSFNVTGLPENETVVIKAVAVDNVGRQTTIQVSGVTNTKQNQTIDFPVIAAKTYGDASFPISATASSNLPVSFAASGNCTVSGNTVHIAGLGSCTITASQSGNTNYNAATDVSRTFNINPKPLNPQITADHKVYDGTTAATILTRTFGAGEVVGADDVTLIGGAATFDTKDVGTGKTVTATGFSLSGTSAGNYVLSSTTAATTANVTAKAASVTPEAASKTYGDGDPAFTGVLSGFVAADNVTASYTRTAGESVGGSPYVISATLNPGGALGNYNITYNTANFIINPKALTVNAAGQNKEYDGTTNATVTLSFPVGAVVGGDTVNATYTSASFADKAVGNGKTINVSGIALTGASAGNYTTSTTAQTAADITARALNVTAAGVDKVYDGTTDATVTLSDNRIAGDVLTASYTSASFADKSVGSGKTVSVSGISIAGADSGNYSANALTTATANITPRTLNVTAAGVNKVYDGTTIATVNLNSDGISGDALTLSYSASFADKVVGIGKPVSVTGIGISGGADGGNYTLGNATASTTADITPKALTITATAQNKEYNGNADASVTLSIQAGGVVGGDVIGTSFSNASFDNKTVGAGKTVTVGGIALTGADAGNYSVANSAITTADITAKALTSVVTIDNKIYDGTTAAAISSRSLTGVIGSDLVTLTGGTADFTDKAVGTGKTVNISGLSLSGADAANYAVSNTTVATADITALAITGNISAGNKVYDGTTNAAILTRTLTGAVVGDDVNYSGGTADFADKNAGTGKTVTANGLSLTGADAANYSVNSTATTYADITPRALTVSATGVNKVYDGTTNAAVTLFDDKVEGDDLTTGYTAASFNDKNVGTAKQVSVSGISISGADAANYAFNTTANTTADITQRALTVKTNDTSKVYGEAPVSFSVSYNGFVNGESTSVLGGALTFSFTDSVSTSAGIYQVTPGDLTSSNYNIAFIAGTFTVNKAAQTIAWSNPADIVYGTTLGASQLNAVVTVIGPAAHGAVNYTPAAGTILNAGAGQLLTVNVAGTNNYEPASQTVVINVAKAPSVITVSAPQFIALGGNVIVSGVLTGVANSPLAGQPVTLSIGSGAAAQSCSAITGADGSASCIVSGINQPIGPNLPVASAFAGNSNYLPSAASSATLVFAYAATGGGSFVIGDRNAVVGTMVNFWGSQWARNNSLTGGAAPNSFKGFANRSTTSPTSCGATWTTDPGNSSNPPVSVPAYMAVIVSSSISQSGSTISGNTSKVVIVRNNPGYGPSPGNTGTGTIVGVLCQ